MVLPTNGALSLNDIHIEAGGASQTACTINDSDIRGLTPADGKTINPTSGTTISINDFYGASNIPDPVARVLWTGSTSTNPTPLGVVPTSSVVANAVVPSGSPNNISSTTHETEVINFSNLYQSIIMRLRVNAISESANTRFYNPKGKALFDINSFSTIGTDLLCKIKLTLTVSMGSPDIVTGSITHAAYYKPSPSSGLTAYLTGSQGSFSGSNLTVTTTQTVQDYQDNNEDLELQVYWANGNTSNYYRKVGSAFVNVTLTKVEYVL